MDKLILTLVFSITLFSYISVSAATRDINRDKIVDSVLFTHHGNIQVTNRHWTITFNLGVHDLLEAATALENDLAIAWKQMNIDEVILLTEHSMNQTVTNVYSNIIVGQRIDLLNLLEKLRKLNIKTKETSEMLSPKTSRKRRALVPIIGSIIELITGSASKNTIDRISNRISNIEQADRMTKHILDEALSAINFTHIQSLQNTKTINNLINTANELFNQLHNTSSYLSHTLSPLVQFISYYTQAQETLDRGRTYVSQLETEYNQRVSELTQLANGKLPISVIGPSHLKQILEEIGDLLPPHLQLPLDITTNLATYYQIMRSTLVNDHDKLFGIVILPIIESTLQYEIYSARSIETPYIDNDKNLQISAEYHLDNLHFVVSNDFTKYSIIDDDVFSICSFEHLNFCPIRTPIYSISTSRDSCTVDLFLNENNNNNACDIKVRSKQYDFPKIIHIRLGDWLVLTKNPVTFAIYCLDKNVKYIDIFPPLQHLNLDHGCYAISQQVSVPAYFEDVMHVDIPRDHFNFTIRETFWKSIIDTLQLNKPVIPEKVRTISGVGDMLSHLREEIKISPMQGSSFDYWYNVFMQILISIISTIVIVIIAEIVIWYGLVKKCKAQCIPRPSRDVENVEVKSGEILESEPLNVASKSSNDESIENTMTKNYNMV